MYPLREVLLLVVCGTIASGKSSVWRISTGCHASEPFHTQVAATRGINVVLLDVNEKVITGSRSAPIVTPVEMRKYEKVQRLQLS
jgi:hypothetical protein